MFRSDFINSKVFRIWSNLADGLFVNALFVITCIPVVTYGAAKTALYETAVKWVRYKDAGTKEYWKSFKANLKTSIPVGIIILLIGVLIAVDYMIALSYPQIGVIAYILIIFFYMFKEQVFMFGARISCTTGKLLQNGARMSLRCFPKAFAAALLWLVPLIMLIFAPEWCIRLTIIWLFGYFSLSAWLTVKMMNSDYMKIFETIQLEQDNRDEVINNK